MSTLKMSVNIVVQARMGSQRLPGKMMLDLYGRPIVYRILDKLRDCSLVNRVVLAIPNTEQDAVLEEVARSIDGIGVVIGSENDLIQRYQQACQEFPSEFVIRFPGDNVFPDPQLIDDLISFHVQHNRSGFSSNLASVFNNKMIDGVGAEIFSSALLMNIDQSNVTASQIEHLHLNFYDYVKKEAVHPDIPVRAPKPTETFKRPYYALDINTIEQYGFIRDVYRNVCLKKSNYTTLDIIEYLDSKDRTNA